MFDAGTNRTDLITTGGQDFDIDYPIYSKNDVAVYLQRVLKNVDIDFTVRTLGGGAPFETIALSDLPALATIRFPIAPDTQLDLAILSTRVVEQQSQYVTAPISPRRLERDLDKMAFICRMIDERVGRALKFAPWSSHINMDVPEPEEGKALGWVSSILTNIPSGKGDKGDTGDAPVFRVDVGTPNDGVGIDGDMYLDSATGDVYLREGGVYVLEANIKGVAGAGAAPTVREVDGSPTISTVAVIEFDSATGLAVAAPGAGAARVSLVQSTLGSALRTIADEATARTALAVPGLATDNLYTGRQRGGKGADIASAATITPGTDGNYFHITGTTGITAIATLAAGTVAELAFDGILILTHSANLILLGGVNFTTAAGVVCRFISEGSGVWREVNRHSPTAASIAMQEFSASATWTRPAGVTKVRISAVAPGGGGGGSSDSNGSGGGGAGEVIYNALIEVSTDLVLTIPAGGATGVDGGDLTIVGTGVSLTLKGGKHGIGGASGATGGNGGGLSGGVGAAAATVGVKGDPESSITEGGASGGGGSVGAGSGNGGPSAIFAGGTNGSTNGGGGGGASIFAKGGNGGTGGAVGTAGTRGSGGGGGAGGGFIAGGAGGAGFIRIEVVA